MSQEKQYSLQELSEQTGLSSRAIRSYIAQDLIRGPVSKGRHARYTEYHRKRLETICLLKDHYGLSMGEIRQALLVAGDEDIQVMALWGRHSQPKGLHDEAPTASNPGAIAAPPLEDRSAEAQAGMATREQRARWRRLQFEQDSGAVSDGPPEPGPRRTSVKDSTMMCDERAFPEPCYHKDSQPERPVVCSSPPPFPPTAFHRPASPIERLLLRLRGMPQSPSARETEDYRLDPGPATGQGAAPRVCRGRTWIGIEVTPDVQISIRGYYRPDDIVLFEQVADHMRAILLGGDEATSPQKEDPAPPTDLQDTESGD